MEPRWSVREESPRRRKSLDALGFRPPTDPGTPRPPGPVSRGAEPSVRCGPRRPDSESLEPNDREIIVRVLSGDRESFDVLLRRHAAPVWGTLRSLVRNAEDAREIFQETWTRAFERLADLREPDRLRSWVLSIALNLARQRHRRPAPASLDAGAEEASADLPADGVPVGTELEECEVRNRVRVEIARLPSRQRQVVDLRVNHDLTHAEIAAALGITEESSRANYYQAIRRLKSVLDRSDP